MKEILKEKSFDMLENVSNSFCIMQELIEIINNTCINENVEHLTVQTARKKITELKALMHAIESEINSQSQNVNDFIKQAYADNTLKLLKR